MIKRLFFILMAVTILYAIDPINRANTYVDDQILTHDQLNADIDSNINWSTRIADTIDVKFIRYSDLTSHDSTLLFISADTCSTSVIKGSPNITGLPDLDSATIGWLDPDTIAAFLLTGKLTAGSVEIEGSNFDIDGADISAATISGGLTWSAAQDLNNQALTNVDINSGNIGPFTLTGKLTGGASEIEGSNFDIDGADISVATISGSLTWSAPQDLNGQALTNVDINSGDAIMTSLTTDTIRAIDADGIIIEDDGGNIALTIEDGSNAKFENSVGIGIDPNSSYSLLLAELNTSSYIQGEVYSTTTSHATRLRFRRSRSGVLGTVAATSNNDYLGFFTFQGVDAGNGWEEGAQITAIQNGSGGSKVPTDLKLETCTSTGWNTNQLVLNTNGKIGVHVSDPDELVEINSTSDEPFLKVQWNDTISKLGSQWVGTTSDDNFHIRSDNTNIITVDGANNRVGINSAFPQTELEVRNDITGPVIQTTKSSIYSHFTHNSIGTATDDDFLINRQGSTRMGVESGHVRVYGTMNAELSGVSCAINPSGTYGAMGTSSNHPLHLIANSSTAIHVATDGDVGINNTNPQTKLQVDGGIRSEGTNSDVTSSGPNISLYDTPNGEYGMIQLSTNGLDFWTYNAGWLRSTRMRKNGYVMINGTVPTEWLDVNGNARFRSIGSGTSAGALHYTSTGVLTTSTSDERLKTDIQPIDEPLEKAAKLNGVYYRWKENPESKEIGMVAQQVEKVVPELVFTNKTDGYKGVHYDKTVALLVEAIKELKQNVDALNQEVSELKKELGR